MINTYYRIRSIGMIALGLLTASLQTAHAAYITQTTIVPYCREFTQTISIGGQLQKGIGTACLQPDGSWQIQKMSANPVIEVPATHYVTVPDTVYVIEQPRPRYVSYPYYPRHHYRMFP